MAELIYTLSDLRALIDCISFGPSALMLHVAKPSWRINELFRDDGRAMHVTGWHMRLELERPDAETGVPGRGHSRWEFIEFGATRSSVVRTAWLLAELYVRHELMESFMLSEVRVFDPHVEVDDLRVTSARHRRVAL